MTAADDYKKICELRELFKGRLDDEEASILLQKHDGSLMETVSFIMQSTGKEVTSAIAEEKAQWQKVTKKVRHLKQREPRILQQARTGLIDTKTRQFGCQPCDNMWWRRCPDRKQVSKCTKCKQCYEPVPRDKEWGWAVYICQCGNEFNSYSQMGTTCPCYQCGNGFALPARIVPPGGPRQPKSRSKHHCNAPDCANNHGVGRRPLVRTATCAHPSNRVSNVMHASELHDCSGSTVATFLPQDDINKDFEVFFKPPLPSLVEQQEEIDGDDDTSSGGSQTSQ